jgi:hypothetical protein
MVGSFVWVEDPEEAWMDGEVVEVNGEEITVNCASRKAVSCFQDLISSSHNRMENVFCLLKKLALQNHPSPLYDI